MGSGTFDAKSYRSFSAAASSKRVDQIYSSRLNASLNPLNVAIRESRDSADSPEATPLIVALDVTGSMGMIAGVIAKQGLGTLFTSILDRKPITNPHVMFMGVGDAATDTAPLQVSQFEADNRIVEQLTQMWIEGRGGSNNSESYNLPWYFAAAHTRHDSYEKRAKRGYLFTIGDEEAPVALTQAQIKKFIGDDVEGAVDPQVSLELAERYYNVFHVVIKEGNHARRHLDRVMSSWTTMLGQHVIPLDDHRQLAEVIVSAIEVAEGVPADTSAGRWSSGVRSVVHAAVKNLPTGRPRLQLGA